MQKIELAYFAGIMDGDGYFTIKRNTYWQRKNNINAAPTYYERCGIKQVQRVAIKAIHNKFGGYFRIEKPTAKNGKLLYSLQLTNLKAHNFIEAIFPYLRVKKKQAQILLILRKSLNEPKTAKGKWHIQKSRWGTFMKNRRAVTSRKQIAFREQLIKKIKSLNDIRPWTYIPS